MNENASGKTVLITGATSGIGKETARQLARVGWRVVVHGRNERKGLNALEELRNDTGNDDIHLLLADLASLTSVREGVAEFQKRFGQIDVLIANAAMSASGVSERSETIDGFELFFGANYLSHYLLVRLLLNSLLASAPSRIVIAGARQMGGAEFDFEDFQMERNWKPFRAILQAKLGMFCMTRELARRLAGTGVTANVFDPGIVKTPYHSKASKGLKLLITLFGKSPVNAAETSTWLATSPDLTKVSGNLYSGRRVVPFKGQAVDDEVARRVWTESARLVGVPEDLRPAIPR